MTDRECGALCLAMFLSGAALGAAAALLLAPQSGARTRRQIRRRAEDMQDYLEDMRLEVKDKVHEVKEAAEDAVRQFERRVRSQ